MKRFFSFFLCICLFFALLLTPTYASNASYNDISGHWAEQEIANMTQNGIIQGYNGLFKPDDYITRGEVAVIINNLMKYSIVETNTFSDVRTSQYRDSILKLKAAGIMVGDGHNYFSPNKNITIEESIKVICSAFQMNLTNDYTYISFFSDNATISNWAKPYISTFVKEGYIDKDTSHFINIRAKQNITRAEFVYLINRVIDTNIKVAQTIQNKTYTKDIIVTADNVNFQNCVLKRIYIAPSVDISTIKIDASTKVSAIRDLSINLYETSGDYTYLLGTFTTAFDESDMNVSTNIRLSVQAVNGKVIAHNDVFSFNNSLGEKSTSKGYKISSEGISQVASTLYNAVLLSGLQATERYQNVGMVSYVNPGKDAAVSWSRQGKDLKFVNSCPIPVKIIGEYNTKGTITFSFYTQLKVPISTIEVKTFKENGKWILQQIINGQIKYTANSIY